MEMGQARGWTTHSRIPQMAVSAAIALVVVACGGGGSDPIATRVSEQKVAALSSADPVGTIAERYTVVNLATNGWVELGPGNRPVNASGQVAFMTPGTSVHGPRAMIFDGATVQEVSPPGSSVTMYLKGISNAGEVLGGYTDDYGVETAFAWANGIFNYPPLPAGSSARLAAMSGGGQAVISMGILGSELRVWNRADNALIGTSGLPTWASPSAINDAGAVVGMSGLPGGRTGTLAFVWTPGVTWPPGEWPWPSSPDVQYAPTPAPGSGSFINTDGLIAGYYNYGSHAFRWNPGDPSITDLTLPGITRLNGLNDAGRLVGYSTDYSTVHRAFIWTPDDAGGGDAVEVSLGGDRSVATAINNAGLTVGWANHTLGGETAAFAWTTSQGVVDLNTRIPDATALGVHLYSAEAVSDNGSIVAHGNTGLVLLRPEMTLTAPTVGPISANDPVSVDTALGFTVGFSDVDTSDTHSALWTWGDGTANNAAAITESNGSGTASGSHTFSEAGVYTVSVEVTDNTGKSATVSRQVVVYDPAAGFVTGGGWIQSPPGAYKQDMALTGQATFAFVSKYQKGANTPSGNTEFRFHSANLNFHSNTYEWLIVAGARAQYKGSGTINGQGQFKFLLTAVDGAKLGGNTPDRFRIKIWQADDDAAVVYDNQLDSGKEGSTSEGTAIAGGSIVVHSK